MRVFINSDIGTTTMIVPFPRATRARFHIITPRPSPNIVAIIDLHDQFDLSMSVTNDAEAVVRNLKELGVLRAGDRLIYRDTEYCWDELALDDNLRFAGFRPIQESSLDGAIRKIRSERL